MKVICYRVLKAVPAIWAKVGRRVLYTARQVALRRMLRSASFLTCIVVGGITPNTLPPLPPQHAAQPTIIRPAPNGLPLGAGGWGGLLAPPAAAPTPVIVIGSPVGPVWSDYTPPDDAVMTPPIPSAPEKPVAAPEPATAALLVSAAVALLVRRRRAATQESI